MNRVTASRYHYTLMMEMRDHPYAIFVTISRHASDLESHACYLSPSGLAGCAVAPDGELVAVFAAPDAPKGECAELIQAVCALGKVTHLHCYDGKLPGFYAKLGFSVHERAYFRGHYKGRKIVDKHGRPDYIRMNYGKVST